MRPAPKSPMRVTPTHVAVALAVGGGALLLYKLYSAVAAKPAAESEPAPKAPKRKVKVTVELFWDQVAFLESIVKVCLGGPVAAP